MRNRARKRDKDVKPNAIFTRVFVDKECDARLTRIANENGRTKQRQLGIILEQIAKLSQSNPTAIQELGIINPQPRVAA